MADTLAQPRCPSRPCRVRIGGVDVDGNTCIRIGTATLSLRQLGEHFALANNFSALFSTPPSAKGGRPRKAPHELGRTAEYAALGTATAVLYAIWNGFPTLPQLSQLQHRIISLREAAGLPCDDPNAVSVNAVEFLHGMLYLRIPQREWSFVVRALKVPLDCSLREVRRHHVAIRDNLAVLPLTHGAYVYPTFLVGLYADVFAPQLAEAAVDDAMVGAQRFMELKLGGDGTFGCKAQGTSSSIESINFHPLSLTDQQARSVSALAPLGVILAPEHRDALRTLWTPIVDVFRALPAVEWRGTQWRLLHLHDGSTLALSTHIGGDGAFLCKLLGFSHSLFGRSPDNPAACILCDASYDKCVRLTTGTPRVTSTQAERGVRAEQEVTKIDKMAPKQQPAARAALMRQTCNTTVRTTWSRGDGVLVVVVYAGLRMRTTYLGVCNARTLLASHSRSTHPSPLTSCLGATCGRTTQCIFRFIWCKCLSATSSTWLFRMMLRTRSPQPSVRCFHGSGMFSLER